MRAISSLSSGLPGTIDDFDGDIPSRVSSRKSAWRVSASGPWQWKHLSERIGRMSRSKSGSAGRSGVLKAPNTTAAATTSAASELATHRSR